MTAIYVKADAKLSNIPNSERLRCGCGCMKFALVRPPPATMAFHQLVCLNCHGYLPVPMGETIGATLT